MRVFVPERLQPRKLAWFGVTLGTLALWFIIANMIPFLQDLMGLMGATCGMALTYFFPIVFALQVLGPNKLGARQRRAMRWVLGAAALAAVVATLSVAMNMVQNMDTRMVPPFSCGYLPGNDTAAAAAATTGDAP